MAIQSGEIEIAHLLQLGKTMKNQHFNAIMAHLLCKVIRENKRLQHLDLQNTNLPAWVIAHIAKRLKKSRSLLALHLTDNQGLQRPGLKDEVHAMLRCKPSEEKNHINVAEVEQTAFRQPSLRRLQTQLSTQSRQGEERNIASDSIRVKQIMQ